MKNTGVKFHGESADVARQVVGALVAGNRGEAHENGRAFTGSLQKICARISRQGLVKLEIAVRRRAAGVNDALRNALMVEMHDLFAQHEVFQQDRAAFADLQRVLIVGNGNALVRGEPHTIARCYLVRFAACARRLRVIRFLVPCDFLGHPSLPMCAGGSARPR
jgi:hypothetical protein